MQLTLAVAVVQHVLPGLGSKPVAFDPEFEPEDVELLKGLGFAVPISQPSHTAAGPTLLYMPCCPRDLYSDVLVRPGNLDMCESGTPLCCNRFFVGQHLSWSRHGIGRRSVTMHPRGPDNPAGSLIACQGDQSAGPAPQHTTRQCVLAPSGVLSQPEPHG